MGDYIIAAFPNEGSSPEAIRKAIGSTLSTSAQVYALDLPMNLLVGTLDTLMNLGDDLLRIDSLVENVVRKIEKQYQDVAGYGAEALRVTQRSPEAYAKQFEWDYAKYAVRQPLPQLVGHIQASVGKIEEELRNLGMAYQERSGAIQAEKRKKGSNLATADLNDVLTEDRLRGVTLVNTEHLETLIVAVSSANEAEWRQTYTSIGSDIASMGGPDWCSAKCSSKIGHAEFGQHGPENAQRAGVKGSPVVPGSSVKIMQEGEMSLYTVTILKGQYQAGFYDGEQFQQGIFVDYVEPFRKVAKEARFIARPFQYDPEHAGEAARKRAQLQVEAQQLHAQLVRWCKAHFGEAMVAWIHIKLIRTFVESVLRYGLPVDFTAVLIHTKKGKDSACLSALNRVYSSKIPMGPQADVDDTDKDEYYAFVSNKFSLLSI